MHSGSRDTAAAGPDLESDYHTDDDHETSGRAGKRRRLVSVSYVPCS